MRYEAALFDVGETLVHPDPSFGGLLSRLLGEFGYPAEEALVDRLARAELVRAMSATPAWSTSAEASYAMWTDIYAGLMRALDIADDTLPDRLYRSFVQPHRYVLFPDAMPALRELRAHGLRLGIISNWEAWAENLLHDLGVSALCEVVVVSGTFGCEKPDEKIFRHALEAMDVRPERAVYIGDSPSHDIAPALTLGMGAVLIDRQGRHAGAHTPSIASLGQLMAVIR